MKILMKIILSVLLVTNAMAAADDSIVNPNELTTTPGFGKIKVQGMVYNEHTKQPVPNVQLVVTRKCENRKELISTDSNGAFVFYVPADKVYELFVNDPAYASKNYLLSSRGRSQGSILFNMTAQNVNP